MLSYAQRINFALQKITISRLITFLSQNRQEYITMPLYNGSNGLNQQIKTLDRIQHT